MTKISEIFASFQGEAGRAGMPSLWVRFFGCNLECQGFGQEFPMEPDTYKKDVFDFNVIKEMKDVPVPQFGCDSSYSWSKQFKHLVRRMSIDEIVTELLALGKDRFDMDEFEWTNLRTGQPIQLCFTGGEPMLNQKTMLEILKELDRRESNVHYITIETNGTKLAKKEFLNYIWVNGLDLEWAVSPKLFSVSGEACVVFPEVIDTYAGSWVPEFPINIKFVVNGTEACWDELDSIMIKFLDKFHGSGTAYWIMPEGATIEDQTQKSVADIVNEGMRRGFKIATRNHIAVYGNQVGT
jgi:7-carboxy-7-deazaguanine synthase